MYLSCIIVYPNPTHLFLARHLKPLRNMRPLSQRTGTEGLPKALFFCSFFWLPHFSHFSNRYAPLRRCFCMCRLPRPPLSQSPQGLTPIQHTISERPSFRLSSTCVWPGRRSRCPKKRSQIARRSLKPVDRCDQRVQMRATALALPPLPDQDCRGASL